MTRIVPLVTGADLRLRNESAPIAVVLANGGSARAVPGTWSSTSELIAHELATRFPGIAFAEVRYRLKTWNELQSCMDDAGAALDLVARPALLVGFSMGGAVSIGIGLKPADRIKVTRAALDKAEKNASETGRHTGLTALAKELTLQAKGRDAKVAKLAASVQELATK